MIVSFFIHPLGGLAKYRERLTKQTLLPDVSLSDVRLISTVRFHYFPNQ
jgi:hypothetical protein